MPSAWYLIAYRLNPMDGGFHVPRPHRVQWHARMSVWIYPAAPAETQPVPHGNLQLLSDGLGAHPVARASITVYGFVYGAQVRSLPLDIFFKRAGNRRRLVVL
jgi:hypothetical protein